MLPETRAGQMPTHQHSLLFVDTHRKPGVFFSTIRCREHTTYFERRVLFVLLLFLSSLYARAHLIRRGAFSPGRCGRG